ncbi:MAG: type IV pilus modification PilV family protein [Caldimonas sp.]
MKKPQQGVMLIEALIAILIFSLGILGMVAMGGVAIAAQSDAQYRTEAANYANEIASQIALDMAQNNYSVSLPNYAHQPAAGGYCSFAGAASGQPIVTNWVNRVAGITDPKRGLPGATVNSQQIMVDTTPGTGFNRVTITICWQPPSSAAVAFAPMHRLTLVTYIN